MGDYGGNCSNVNVKGTNECCAASTMDTNDRFENLNSAVYVKVNIGPQKNAFSPIPVNLKTFPEERNSTYSE